MARPVEFWFEFASTYSYPAAMQIEAVCAEADVPLIWKSFLLGPVFGAQGLTDSPFNIYPVKGAYMWRDVERICADAGLAFHKPTTFPRGSLLAARIAARWSEADWVGAFVRAIYTANFRDDRDIGDAGIIALILEELGQSAEDIIAAALSDDGKAMLRKNTEEAMTRAVFGAPTITVGDEVFWGHDRLAQAIRWTKRA